MKFDFTWLEDFLALAATGNFTRAAQQRHSSQPAFSRRIRALEEWLGTPLVDRGTQPARLTDAGEWFRGTAEQLVARTARLPGEARQIAEARSATLRIASTHALSFTFVPRWLRGLEAKLALGPVELASDVLARCQAQMQQGKVHFVLAHAREHLEGPLDAPAYVSALIGEDRLLPVCKPTAAGRPQHRLDGRRHKGAIAVLAYTEESGMGRVMREVLAPRLDALGCETVFSAHLASVLRSMALDGRGIAWLPQTLVEDDLAAGTLVAAADASWEVPLEIRLYRPREALAGPAEALWAAAVPEGLST
jgi:DNA-binding transcriptional LysR family regulator